MKIVRVSGADTQRIHECARMMVSSDPWLTLRRPLDAAINALGDPTKELHVVLNGDTLIAFVLLDMHGPLAGYIQSVCVRPADRGRGLGGALIASAEERIFEESPNVFMCVSSFNIGAQRLYERLGYEVVGRLSAFVVPEHDELLLRKSRGPWSRHKTAATRGR